MKDYMTYLEDRYFDKISFKLIEKDTEDFYKSNSLAACYDIGMKLYTSANYQVQEAGIYLLGYSATEYEDGLVFLRDEVSQHENWRVQEVLEKSV